MIGVYGGTFDPVHFGHLRPAVDVKEDLGLEQIRFIPCGQPPHRQQTVADASQRLAMLHLALDPYPDLVVDDCEINRPGPSYMIDTLADLKQQITDKTFSLIIGMDAFAEFDKWKNWQEIFILVNIIVTHRPTFVFGGSQINEMLKSEVISRSVKNSSELAKNDSGSILFYPVTQLDISSTLIRENVQQNKDNRFLMPDDVMNYIQQEKIYN